MKTVIGIAAKERDAALLAKVFEMTGMGVDCGVISRRTVIGAHVKGAELAKLADICRRKEEGNHARR